MVATDFENVSRIFRRFPRMGMTSIIPMETLPFLHFSESRRRDKHRRSKTFPRTMLHSHESLSFVAELPGWLRYCNFHVFRDGIQML